MCVHVVSPARSPASLHPVHPNHPKSQARKKCSKSKSREITSKAFKRHNHLLLWGFAKALGELSEKKDGRTITKFIAIGLYRFRGHIALEVGN